MCGDQVNIEPSVNEDMTKGTDIVVQLENVHEFVFLFHAVVAALRNRAPATALQTASRDLLSVFSEGEASPAVQAWVLAQSNQRLVCGMSCLG